MRKNGKRSVERRTEGQNSALAFHATPSKHRSRMKKLFILTPLLLAAAFAQADVTIEQKIESPVINGTTTTKVKGDLMRVDTPMPGGAGTVTMIIDLAKGKSTTLMAAQKMAMTADLTAVKEAAQALAGDASKTEPPKPTGKSEKVGAWNADIYEFTAAGSTFKLWVAKDFPNGAAIKAQMDKLSKATVGAGVDLSKFNLPGMTVKTEMNGPQMKMTSTVVSVKEGPVADSEFTVPSDYQVMQLPTGAGAGS